MQLSGFNVAANAYEQLMLRMRDAPIEILEANGSILAREFAPWLTDMRAAEAQFLIQKPEIVDRFTGLKFLAKGHTKQHLIPAVMKALVEMQGKHAEQFNRNLIRIIEYELGGMLDAEPADLTPGASAFRQTNIAQHHKNLQLKLVGDAFKQLLHVEVLIQRLCNLLEYDFSVLPLWVMPSSRMQMNYNHFLKSEAYGIDEFLSPGQSTVRNRLMDNYLRNILHEVGSPRDQYWEWFHTPGYAKLTHRFDNHTMYLGPNLLPPFLWDRPDEFIAYYPAPSRPTFLIEESIYIVRHWSPNSNNTKPFLPTTTHSMAALADLLPVYCALLTLISTTTPTGQGQHKPVWAASPFNLALCKLLPRAVAVAIAEAEREIANLGGMERG